MVLLVSAGAIGHLQVVTFTRASTSSPAARSAIIGGAVIAFDEALRARIRANLDAHERRRVPLEDRRHAAVAIVLADSDAERHDHDPLFDVDMSVVPGAKLDPQGDELDGRMVGVAGGASLLLCRRAIGLRRHAGQWALPGGRLDEGEEPLGAALRELDEELGLRLGAEDVVGWLDDYVSRSGFVISPVVLWCGGEPELAPDPNEVFAVYRIGLRALEESDPRSVSIPESPKPVLQLPLGNDLIHAPTGAILLQFRQVGLFGRIGERNDEFDEPVFAWR